MTRSHKTLRHHALLLMGLLALGCGEDEEGGTTAEGMVQGRTLRPIRSVYASMNSPTALSVVLDEGATSCADRSQGGEKLAIIFPCPVQPGTHAVALPRDAPPDCSGTSFANAVLEEGSGFDIAGATGGEVTVSDAGDPLVGTFDISFGGSHRLRGGFQAKRCPTD